MQEPSAAPPQMSRRVIRVAAETASTSHHNRSKERLISRSLLVLLFILSFLLPLYFGLRVTGLLTDSTHSPAAELDPVFPDAVPVHDQGAFIRISGSRELLPKHGEDFLMTAWFKLRKLPSKGERMILFAKADNKAPFYPGYSLSLVREGQEIHPIVYWRDAGGVGGWYLFSEIEPRLRTWFMMTLSVRGGTLLGLHYTVLPDEGKPRTTLLGGYRFSQPVYPESASDLVIGALTGGSFRGSIGPVGVFSGVGFTERFKQIQKRLIRDPLNVPSFLSKDEVKLWCKDGKSDASVEQHAVETQERPQKNPLGKKKKQKKKK